MARADTASMPHIASARWEIAPRQPLYLGQAPRGRSIGSVAVDGVVAVAQQICRTKDGQSRSASSSASMQGPCSGSVSRRCAGWANVPAMLFREEAP